MIFWPTRNVTALRARHVRLFIRRVYHGLRFILDYGLLRTNTTGMPTPVRERRPVRDVFRSPREFLQVQLRFSPRFRALLPPAAPTRVIRCASGDPQQHSLLFTADTKADFRNVITVIMKIHGARESGRFILLTFR